MCNPPNVVDMYIHSLLDKLDQGFSRPRIKTVRAVGDKIEASQGNKAHCLTKIFLSLLRVWIFPHLCSYLFSKALTWLVYSGVEEERGVE
jgi:hypothetical protein